MILMASIATLVPWAPKAHKVELFQSKDKGENVRPPADFRGVEQNVVRA